MQVLEAVQDHKVVSNEEWLQARTALLAEEKAYTRQRDELSRKRRELPWVRVEKEYLFDGPKGKQSLSDLFDGRSQLVVYHFMLAPGWAEGCPGCSFLSDHVDGARMHFEHNDISFTAVSRAPWKEIEPFKRRMGWSFHWVSSNGSDFNYDYHVSFTKDEVTSGKGYYNFGEQPVTGEEAPGVSVFYKDDAGTIFHTYSAYARGLEGLVGAYDFMDLVPRGRNENGADMRTWLKHHDKYESAAVTSSCCHEKKES